MMGDILKISVLALPLVCNWQVGLGTADKIKSVGVVPTPAIRCIRCLHFTRAVRLLHESKIYSKVDLDLSK